MITSEEHMEFSKWLGAELEERGWNQSDLSRASRLSTALISKIMTGTRNPGPSACKQIAKALGYPVETVYKIAGLLPPTGERNRRREYLEFIAEQLDDKEYQELLDYIEFRLSKKNK